MKTYNQHIFLFENVVTYSSTDLKELLGNEFEFFVDSGFLQSKQNKASFSFVGFLTTKEHTISILPKYCYLTFLNLKDEHSKIEFLKQQSKLLLKILSTYKSRVPFTDSDYELVEKSPSVLGNELEIAAFILNDFVNYGFYSQIQNKYSSDHQFEIDWEKTIHQTDSIISRKYPIYHEIVSIKPEIIFSSIITEIHRWSVYYCQKKYGDLLECHLSDVDSINIECIGPPSYLISVLEKQLHLTYAIRQIELIKNLKILISIFDSGRKIKMVLGKNKFEHIWESALGYLLGNQLKKYLEHIPKAVWYNSSGTIYSEKERIRPDILVFVPEGKSSDSLLIADAKYYLIKYLEEQQKVINNPGLQDIAKQYFYEFVLDTDKISYPWRGAKIINTLFFPDESINNLYEFKGYVEVNNKYSKKLLNVSFNPYKLFIRYMNSNPFEPEEYKNFINYLSKY